MHRSLALALATALICPSMAAATASAADGRTDPAAQSAQSSQTTVLLVHGLNHRADDHTQAIDCENYWGPYKKWFVDHGRRWTFTIKYYDTDRYCNNDIGRSGIHGRNNDPRNHQVFHGGPAEHGGRWGGHDQNTSIDHLGYHLAWHIYWNYTQFNKPVDIVAHSMGGLITRKAVQGVANSNPAFPSRLLIEDIVTVGTPHQGSDIAHYCDIWYAVDQCAEMSPGSSFIRSLAMNPNSDGSRVNPEWSLIGSLWDEAVNPDYSASADSRNYTTWRSGHLTVDGRRLMYDERHEIGHLDFLSGPRVSDKTYEFCYLKNRLHEKRLRTSCASPANESLWDINN